MNNVIIAEANNIKISPRKVRLVVDSIRKHEIQLAISELSILNKRAALPVKKLIESAVANAVNNFKLKKEDLVIAEIMVGEGGAFKRFHFAARGRTRPYKKRISNIRVVLGVKNLIEATNIKESVKAEEKNVESKKTEVKVKKTKGGSK